MRTDDDVPSCHIAAHRILRRASHPTSHRIIRLTCSKGRRWTFHPRHQQPRRKRRTITGRRSICVACWNQRGSFRGLLTLGPGTLRMWVPRSWTFSDTRATVGTRRTSGLPIFIRTTERKCGGYFLGQSTWRGYPSACFFLQVG